MPNKKKPNKKSVKKTKTVSKAKKARGAIAPDEVVIGVIAEAEPEDDMDDLEEMGEELDSEAEAEAEAELDEFEDEMAAE